MLLVKDGLVTRSALTSSAMIWPSFFSLFPSLLLLLLSLPLLYFTFYLFFLPMNRIRSVEEVGFAHVAGEGKRKRIWINRLRRGRRRGNTPPDFPNGWYVVAESREVPVGHLRRVSALGLYLAVFRGLESGQIFVTDAYCPHLGADITSGGKVVRDCVQCPFHNWVFSGETGKCVEIPYAEKLPPAFAKLTTYKSLERNGLVYLWYHAEDEEPSWSPPELPQLSENNSDDDSREKKKRSTWVYQGRTEYEVCCHIQDIPENGADVAHLDAIHRSSILVGGEPSRWAERLMSHWAWHEWGIGWRAETEEGRRHRAVVELKHCMNVGGGGSSGGWKVLSMDVRGEQIGPSTVHLFFDSIVGKGVMIQYVLPLEPMLQKMVHVFYTERSWPPPYAKLALYGESILLERDIKIWNSKSYLDRPILVSEDSLVLKHRRWYSQFYSERKKSGKDDKVLEW